MTLKTLTPINYAWYAALLLVLYSMFYCIETLIVFTALIWPNGYLDEFKACHWIKGIGCLVLIWLSEKDTRWQVWGSIALAAAWWASDFNPYNWGHGLSWFINGLKWFINGLKWFISGQWLPPEVIPVLGGIILIVLIWQTVIRPRLGTDRTSWMPRHKAATVIRDLLFPSSIKTNLTLRPTVVLLILLPILAASLYFSGIGELPVEAIVLGLVVAIGIAIPLLLLFSDGIHTATEALSQAQDMLGFEYFDGEQDALARELSDLKLFDTWPWDRPGYNLSIKGRVHDRETILMYAWRDNFPLLSLIGVFNPYVFSGEMMCIAACFRIATPTLPSFYLEPQHHWWSRINPERGVRTDFDVTRSYMVEPSDSRDVQRLFQPPVMKFLELHKGWYVYNEGSWFIAYKRWGKGFDSERICRFASDAHKLLRLFQGEEKGTSHSSEPPHLRLS